MLTRTLPILIVASMLAALPLLGTAGAQEPAEEVLCPIFIPESPVKYCIEITGNGCVHIHITTFGIPTNPSVNENTCYLP